MSEGGSDEFSGRLGLIFATIGAAIGTGNIWRFPRMVGANGGGSFLVPWLIFLCLLYTSPSPRDGLLSRMPSSA